MSLKDRIEGIWRDSPDPLRDLGKWAREPDEPERKAERYDALAEWAGRHKRNADHDEDSEKAWRRRQRVWRRLARKHAKKAAEEDVPPMVDGGWHPNARRAGVVSPIGTFPPGMRRVALWHTTEGTGLPTYNGSNPHFTIDPRAGDLYQHQSVAGGARALKNLPGGVETNALGAIQVEIIGSAASMHAIDEEAIGHLAELARWIEEHCGVARESNVQFVPNASGSSRLSGAEWTNAKGHLGHQHVPENDHWDPGGLPIARILD